MVAVAPRAGVDPACAAQKAYKVEVLRDGVKFNLMPSFLGKNMTLYQRLYTMFSEPGLFQSIALGAVNKMKKALERVCARALGFCKLLKRLYVVVKGRRVYPARSSSKEVSEAEESMELVQGAKDGSYSLSMDVRTKVKGADFTFTFKLRRDSATKDVKVSATFASDVTGLHRDLTQNLSN